jgi:hypothetical protein
MTREDIIRMAQECHLIGMRPHLDGLYQESIEKFAALVAAHEREKCAMVVEINAMSCNEGMLKKVLNANADAIRARGQG